MNEEELKKLEEAKAYRLHSQSEFEACTQGGKESRKRMIEHLEAIMYIEEEEEENVNESS